MKKITIFMILLTVTMSMQAASWLSGEYDPAGGGGRKELNTYVRAGCLEVVVGERQPAGKVDKFRQDPLLSLVQDSQKEPTRKRRSSESTGGANTSSACGINKGPKAPCRDQSNPSSRSSSRCSQDFRDTVSPVIFTRSLKALKSEGK